MNLGEKDAASSSLYLSDKKATISFSVVDSLSEKQAIASNMLRASNMSDGISTSVLT